MHAGTKVNSCKQNGVKSIKTPWGSCDVTVIECHLQNYMLLTASGLDYKQHKL